MLINGIEYPRAKISFGSVNVKSGKDGNSYDVDYVIHVQSECVVEQKNKNFIFKMLVFLGLTQK